MKISHVETVSNSLEIPACVNLCKDLVTILCGKLRLHHVRKTFSLIQHCNWVKGTVNGSGKLCGLSVKSAELDRSLRSDTKSFHIGLCSHCAYFRWQHRVVMCYVLYCYFSCMGGHWLRQRTDFNTMVQIYRHMIPKVCTHYISMTWLHNILVMHTPLHVWNVYDHNSH